MSSTEDDYKIPVPDSQESLRDSLLTQLNDSDKQGRVDALHNFLFPLLSPGLDKHRGLQWMDPVQAYLPLEFLRPDGNFLAAKAITPFLAQWKYVCRSAVLYQAVKEREHFNGALEL
jgi:hypothetical protein